MRQTRAGRTRAKTASNDPEADDKPPSRNAGGFSQAAATATIDTGKQVNPGQHNAQAAPARPLASAAALRFHKRFFPGASRSEWNDWRWQVMHRLQTIGDFQRILRLSTAEEEALARRSGALPAAVTPYYASLLDADDPAQPLRRTVIPTPEEWQRTAGEDDDPLGEDHQSPVPGLVHRYPDRVLLLSTGFCSTYCRYCTRSRLVGPGADCAFGQAQWQRAIEYIAATPSVRDVLVSGGDPLTLADEPLEWLLAQLRDIPHVEIIRLGTKVPAVLPQRVTPQLARMLRRYHPLFLSLHFTHPAELTPESEQACGRLADAGIPLGSQTVLLAGINDSVGTMKELMHGLLRMRVRPYYLYQCDPITGSRHFRTPVAKGLEIIAGLRGHTTGYAIPTYVIDAPGGGGKIPLQPETVVGREGDGLLLRNREGRVFRYPEAECGTG